jgi:hypothetical protein
MDYPWQAELEALRKETEEKGHYREPVRFPDGKIPLSEALAWIDEHARRPEIMAAWSSVGLREEIPDEAYELILEFETYLRLLRPTVPDTSPYLGIPVRRLSHGVYSSPSDPELVAALLRKSIIADDRNAK